MTFREQKRALACAVKAARVVGGLMRKNLASPKKVNFESQHDIKLELDVRSQRTIVRILRAGFPGFAVLGEEGFSGDPNASERWVVDPIDGTVNFAFGIPHACVSIALQSRQAAHLHTAPKFSPSPATKEWERVGERAIHLAKKRPGSAQEEPPLPGPLLHEMEERETEARDGYVTVAGVVYDPFCDELWTAIRGQPARLNGKVIHVSDRRRLADCIVSTGFAKSPAALEMNLPYFNKLVRRARKVRMMGVAALALAYVATGRFDAYVETGIWLWDIAAGGLLIECAGGEFWHQRISAAGNYKMIASNGRLRKKLLALQPGFMD